MRQTVWICDFMVFIGSIIFWFFLLKRSFDGDEGVLRHDDVSVGPAADCDRLAFLPRALGPFPLQGAGLLQLGWGTFFYLLQCWWVESNVTKLSIYAKEISPIFFCYCRWLVFSLLSSASGFTMISSSCRSYAKSWRGLRLHNQNKIFGQSGKNWCFQVQGKVQEDEQQ